MCIDSEFELPRIAVCGFPAQAKKANHDISLETCLCHTYNPRGVM